MVASSTTTGDTPHRLKKTLKNLRMREKLAVLLKRAVVLALLAGPVDAIDQGFHYVSIPIPVAIDGQPVHCPLYLKLEMKTDNIPIDQYAAAPMEKAQTMFVTAVEAVRKGDTTKFASVWTAPNQMRNTGRSSVALVEDNSANGWMRVIRDMFDFADLTVVAEAFVGSDWMFIWDSTAKNGIRGRNAFDVGLDKKDQLRLSAVSSATDLQALVLDAFMAAQTKPEAYKPLQTVHTHISI